MPLSNVLFRLLFALAAVVASGAMAARPGDLSTRCSLSPSDRLWLDQALAGWSFVAREKLGLGDVPLPRIVMFDQRCTYSLARGPNQPRPWAGMPHAGRVRLPDGQALAIAPIAYAAIDSHTGEGFLVMSLPAVWRAAGHRSPLGLESFLQGVMVHELTHPYQFYFARPRLEALKRRYRLSNNVTDESLQEAFKVNRAYVADFENERDLLFRSAAASDDREARHLACTALAEMRTRRARYFVGSNQKWASLDEIYLTMEGQAQWAMYSWWTDSRGKAVAPAKVLPQIRSSGASWDQDEGLALFLVIDRLVPGWQRLAFAPRPETAEVLLARACA